MKSSPFHQGGVRDEANGFALAIPSDCEELRFVCRESFVGGDSAFNYPLSSRYEEMDTIVGYRLGALGARVLL